MRATAICVDGETGNNTAKNGEGIVDLFDTLSIGGRIENGEIVIYDSTEGIK